MRVMKFGGTSMGSAASIREVKRIVDEVKEPVVVVVSAVGGVTDGLLAAAEQAVRGDAYFEELEALKELHRGIVRNLFEDWQRVSVKLAAVWDQIDNLLKGIALLRELSPRSRDLLSGQGELLSSILLHAFMPDSEWIDSRELIVTRPMGARQLVLEQESYLRIGAMRERMGARCVLPGFIAADENGIPTTLGRGGSDYSAALVAAALEASVLEIWTDVDGFMSADPRIISRAYVLDHLTYSEAMELSHFGAKVIYAPTILPVLQKEIPIYIKNTFRPEAPGTRIDSRPNGTSVQCIKGISSIRQVSLLTLQGMGMVGVVGISMRLFAALAQEYINVILISQASSENSISFVVETKDAALAQRVVNGAFHEEIFRRQVHPVAEEAGMAVVAIVGERMKHTPGVAGQLFHALGRSGVNVFAIAQGASEVNISLVIKEENLKKTLNVLHDAFFLSEYQVLHLFLAGVGTVGSKLMNKLLAQQEKLRKSDRLVVRLAGVSNSRKMIFNPQGLDLATVSEQLACGETASIGAFRERIVQYNLSNSVFVDCTAHAEVADMYLDLLQSNVHVVTANKIASSSDYAHYSALKEASRQRGVRFLFETNVGAALPIISPINDLVKSGDRIARLEAVLSGTLNYILNGLSAEKTLSQVIVEAMKLGFSEPDPRIDLSGMDVARKLLILAREAGYALEPGDIERDTFVPEGFFTDQKVPEFLQSVAALDSDFEMRRKALESRGLHLRYVASLEDGKASIGFREVDATHPFYHLEGSNNIVLIWSDHYRDHPMQIKGYGAGAEVTAAGVFADIIKVANR